MDNTNYTFAEDFILPSEAKIYTPTFDPHVKLRSMTVRDELKRTNPQNYSIHRNLCEIIDNCLLTKLPISSYDLAYGDYEFLIHKLRVVTYGPDYKMIVGCPNERCNSVHETTLSLDELKVKELNLEEFDSCLNITLPVTKKKIRLFFETPRSRDNVAAEVKEMNKKAPDLDYDPRDKIKVRNLIDTIDGNQLKYAELETFLDNLPARDFTYILRKIDKATAMIGLDTSITLKCPKCKGDIRTFFRFGPEFFRPTNDD